MLALIYAGGLGKRLRPLTDAIPKPMIRVGGKPILQWQLEHLRRHDVRRILLLVGYKAEAIEKYFGDGSAFGVEIKYSREEEPLGTAGSLAKALELVNTEKFLLLNGDIITNIDVRKLLEALDNEPKAGASIAAVELPSPFGVLQIDESGLVRGFVEKPRLKDVWINAGLYAMRKSVVEGLCPRRGDVERTLLPALAEEGRLVAVRYPGALWKSIDSFKDLEEAEELVSLLR
ncbi:MAG: nucleotidyltransferase family protein [Fervidicoccaceae archaeon]